MNLFVLICILPIIGAAYVSGEWISFNRIFKCLVLTSVKTVENPDTYCGHPGVPEYGDVRTPVSSQSRRMNMQSTFPPRTQVLYECKEKNRVLRGESIRWCGLDGRWTGTRPWCGNDSPSHFKSEDPSLIPVQTAMNRLATWPMGSPLSMTAFVQASWNRLKVLPTWKSTWGQPIKSTTSTSTSKVFGCWNKFRILMNSFNFRYGHFIGRWEGEPCRCEGLRSFEESSSYFQHDLRVFEAHWGRDSIELPN